jgi:hypothetical protein
MHGQGLKKGRRFFPSRRHPSGVVFNRAHEQRRDIGLHVTSTRKRGVRQNDYEQEELAWRRTTARRQVFTEVSVKWRDTEGRFDGVYLITGSYQSLCRLRYMQLEGISVVGFWKMFHFVTRPTLFKMRQPTTTTGTHNPSATLTIPL